MTVSHRQILALVIAAVLVSSCRTDAVAELEVDGDANVSGIYNVVVSGELSDIFDENPAFEDSLQTVFVNAFGTKADVDRNEDETVFTSRYPVVSSEKTANFTGLGNMTIAVRDDPRGQVAVFGVDTQTPAALAQAILDSSDDAAMIRAISTNIVLGVSVTFPGEIVEGTDQWQTAGTTAHLRWSLGDPPPGTQVVVGSLHDPDWWHSYAQAGATLAAIGLIGAGLWSFVATRRKR